MLNTMKNAWRIPDLRKKILFTLFIVIVFRFGSVIPVPFLDIEALRALIATVDESGSMLSYINMMTGGAFSQATLFAMGIIPYINSSIIMQLLTVAIPALERLAKEGEEGRKKIGAITRYATIILGLLQGIAFYFYLLNSGITLYSKGFPAVFSAVVIVLAFTAGTALLMWLGEQINEKGIGNGISIILFAGIVARMPATVEHLWAYLKAAVEDPSNFAKFFVLVPIFVILFLFVIWVIIYMNDAERRLPIQYAKRVVGRKMYGGQSTYIPIKVGMSGVMPVIFASSILSIPSTIEFFMGDVAANSSFWQAFFKAMSSTGWLYSVIYFLLIILFAFFYITIQYNPIEMANNLRQNNGTIPGIRPGRPTSEFISKILSKITLIGALFLAFIALLPIVYGNLTGMINLTLGGTSVIILVGVALETVKQVESQMMLRHYKGFLD